MFRTMLTASTMTTLGALPVFLLTAQVVYVGEDLHFDAARLGLAASLFFGAAAASSLPAGVLAERLGNRLSTAVAGWLGVVSCLGIALFAQSYVELLVFVVVAGFVNAAMQNISNLSLARSIPAGRQGLAFGLKQSAIPVSILLGGLAVPTLGTLLGWRATFVAAAVASGLMAMAGLFMPKVSRRPHRRTTVARDRPPAKALLATTVAMALASAAVNALGAFLPAWAYENGMQPGETGYLLAAASATSVVGRIVSGVAADRRRGYNLPVVSAQMAVGAVGLVLISTGDTALLVIGTCLGFAIGWSWPGLLMFAVVRISRDSPATATGALQTGGFLGGALGPVLFGVIVSTSGYELAWPAAIGSLSIAAVLLLVARRMFVADIARRPPAQPFGSPSRSSG